MRAGVFVDVDEFAVEEVEPLPAGPRDVIVRVGASGVCHSDLSVLSGLTGLPGPIVLGHEAAGRVEWVGAEVTRVAVGDHVIASLNPMCGACWFCARGETHLCETSGAIMFQPRVTRSGGDIAPCMAGLGSFAEAMTVSETSLVRIETDLPDDQIALLGCGVTTGLGAVINAARPPVGATIAVIGLGGVGMASLQGARICGASTIVAIDPVEAKRTAALRLGATHAIDPSVGPIDAQVRELTGGRGVDVVVEAVGSGPLLEQALGATRRGGTTVVVGSAAFDVTVALTPAVLMIDDRTIQGAYFGRTRALADLPKYVRLAETGRLDLSSMVSRRISLDEVGEALASLAEGGDAIRSVVV